MYLSEIKNILPSIDKLIFALEDGTSIPEHFHVTEIGMVNKHFIDCGGTIRTEKKVNFQLWHANDVDHRLQPQKLMQIIQLSEDKLTLEDASIEVEFQGRTIEQYDLNFDGKHFVLVSKKTDCLAQDKCGIPQEKLQPKVKTTACCTPGSSCC